MGKSNTLTAMIVGAALAGGVMYFKRLSEEQQKAAADTLDQELDDLKRENAGESVGWHATYTIDGEEVSSDEVKERFKEEAGKAIENFRADAKVASEEILVGLKKAISEMKTAVEGARKAAAERRMSAEAEKEEGCCCEGEGECCCESECCCEGEADSCCEKVVDGECCCEEMKEAAKDLAEDVKDAFEDVKDTLQDAAEEVKDQFNN